MSGLSDVLDAIIRYGTLEETGIIPPFLVTVETTSKPIFDSQSSLDTKVYYVGIEVRNMGTASYIDVGTFGNVNARLLSKGSSIEYDAPKGKFVDARTLMCVSDASDSILEISGVYA